MRWLFLTVALVLPISFIVKGQISKGGQPLTVPLLKSQRESEIIMPPVNNRDLLIEAVGEQNQRPLVKPFRFAHSFDVHISPAVEGGWITNVKGYDVWRVKIRSKEAYSLYLVFDKFQLSTGARLFIFDENREHIKGAFTSFNNKKSGKFAVTPVTGDELTVQYEVPADCDGKNDFIIKKVNHDFVNILKYDERRPAVELPGDCNIDINCEIGKRWAEIKDAVCRIITENGDIGTGTLINNMSEDQKPYIISAAHTFIKPENSETSTFVFNYESPYCAVLDGDPCNSISSATMCAFSDSLDFALMELSADPPPEFRPYFAGWDHSGNIPDSTFSIHHPQGHIKKISIDFDKPLFSDYPSSDYTKNGFLKILRWDIGVTEKGSSGGALFNPEQNLIGTLTGGEALCSNPINDYFARFDMAWEYKPDSSKQLKCWLDPINTGKHKVEGRRFYVEENLCLAFTNLTDDDEHRNIPVKVFGQFAGYWGGTNNAGITGFAERFSIRGNENLFGISLGVGKIDLQRNSLSSIRVYIYDGSTLPTTIIHSQPVSISSLVADAMNFVKFNKTVQPADTFFVGFELVNMQPQDTFVVYQSLRMPDKENFFYFKENEQWYDFKGSNTGNYSMTNVFELIACNIDMVVNDTPLVNQPLEALIYPNPANSFFIFEAGQTIDPENISVYNLIGQEVRVKFSNHQGRKIRIDLSGNIPGVYFVRVKIGRTMISRKVTYVPW